MSIWKDKKLYYSLNTSFYYIGKSLKYFFLTIFWLIILGPVFCVLLVLYDYFYLKITDEFRFERYENTREFLQLEFINKDEYEIIDLMQKAGANCHSGKITDIDRINSPKWPVNSVWISGCEYNSRYIGWNGFMEYRIYFLFDKNKKCTYFFPIIYRIHI